jgi:hypothetical protein
MYYSGTEQDRIESEQLLERIKNGASGLAVIITGFISNRFPKIMNFIVGYEPSGPSTYTQFRKILEKLSSMIWWLVGILLFGVVVWYATLSLKPKIKYVEYVPDVLSITTRRWAMAPCHQMKKTEIDMGRVTLVSNETHVVYLDIDVMLKKQMDALFQLSEWTDVVCASMMGPNANTSMPCSCSLLTAGGPISGYNLHVESVSGKARIIEHVPVLGDASPTQKDIPKKLRISYFDVTTRNRTDISFEGMWTSTAQRAITLMNDIGHLQAIIKK